MSDDAKNKCLRHRVEANDRRCRLCEAKRKARGKFEHARRIFIKGNK
jgi:hypothetical protein